MLEIPSFDEEPEEESSLESGEISEKDGPEEIDYTKCITCKGEPKYKCPHCKLAKYCSVKCFKIHKSKYFSSLFQKKKFFLFVFVQQNV